MSVVVLLDSYVSNQLYGAYKYIRRPEPKEDKRQYRATMKGVVARAFGMDVHESEDILEGGFEFIEPIIFKTMNQLKNKNNKTFRENLKDCKLHCDKTRHCLRETTNTNGMK